MKRIVDIHQGQINIRNREQGGLEVVISLPIPTAAPATESPNNAIDKIKQTLTGHF
ncbi:Osmolarity sensory histidine kinase EnvZ [Acinetobacter sp. neg1]|nr:Osmolarity sensory histidine kinase EnvZ [Acinetobacter sp. neg1]